MSCLRSFRNSRTDTFPYRIYSSTRRRRSHSRGEVEGSLRSTDKIRSFLRGSRTA
ncbi:hypothetical protein CJF30_00003136 [Rutstroemia sp. NJR-2017a BBW]|nr:hypothetical protein CJF30_00003136 [Rutstroemia sp. NJR-2017a BBW]